MAQPGQDSTRPPARSQAPAVGPGPEAPRPILLVLLPLPLPQCLIPRGFSAPGPRPHSSAHPSVGSDLESFTKPLPSLCAILPAEAPTLLLPVSPPPDSLYPHRAVE